MSIDPPIDPPPSARPKHTRAAVLQKVRDHLAAMKKGAPSDAEFKTAATTLLKYVGNVANNPGEEKVRGGCGGVRCPPLRAALPGGLEG